MLFRLRTQVPDKPGALAEFAAHCREHGINVLRLQIFADTAVVTNELIVRPPDHFDAPELERVLSQVREIISVHPCGERALADQPARYVEAARSIIENPARFPEIVARLFDAEHAPADDATSMDVLTTHVDDVEVQVRRHTPFTDTERARGRAIAALVSDVVAMKAAAPVVPRPGTSEPEFVTEKGRVNAVVNGVVVGSAYFDDPAATTTTAVELNVQPAWQGRGLGTRLLREITAVARKAGLTEIAITTTADNEAVLPMALKAGVGGRVRANEQEIVVRIPLTSHSFRR